MNHYSLILVKILSDIAEQLPEDERFGGCPSKVIREHLQTVLSEELDHPFPLFFSGNGQRKNHLGHPIFPLHIQNGLVPTSITVENKLGNSKSSLLVLLVGISDRLLIILEDGVDHWILEFPIFILF